MSWQAYVDQNLVGTQKVTKAAIHGLDGTPWATSAGFSVKPDEVKNIVKAFSDASGIRASGLHVAGEKYIAIKTDDRSVYGKKGACGVCCVKTKQAVLIGVYDDKIQPGEAAKIVEALADYLIKLQSDYSTEDANLSKENIVPPPDNIYIQRKNLPRRRPRIQDRSQEVLKPPRERTILGELSQDEEFESSVVVEDQDADVIEDNNLETVQAVIDNNASLSMHHHFENGFDDEIRSHSRQSQIITGNSTDNAVEVLVTSMRQIQINRRKKLLDLEQNIDFAITKSKLILSNNCNQNA
ncbi:hypothetical protein MIR68_001645 [Amoeboaphelidium protococcarum]|nr:hypothetical protein MIR68_001645 [Amoeboaphelidium protococcarum]